MIGAQWSGMFDAGQQPGPMTGRKTRESPPQSDIRIIGVELTVTDPAGQTEELVMYPASITLADVRGPRGERLAYGGHRVNITLHTSEGDRAAQIMLT